VGKLGDGLKEGKPRRAISHRSSHQRCGGLQTKKTVEGKNGYEEEEKLHGLSARKV